MTSYAFIPAGHYLAVFRFLLTGSTKEFTTAIGGKTAPGDTAFDSAFFQHNAITTAGRPWNGADMGTMYTLADVTVTQNDAGVLHQAVELINVTGSAGISPPAPNTTMLLKKLTGVVGRNGNGRMFLPPVDIDEGFIDATGVVDPGNLSVLQARWAAYYGAFAPTVNGLVLFHPSAGVASATPIESLSLEPMVATQRRRLR